MDAAPRDQPLEDGPEGATDTDSKPWDAPPRPRLRERFTRAQLVSRSAWAAGGLLIAYAAAAFAVRGMWLDLALLWICPILWMFAAGMVVAVPEFRSEKPLRRARRVPARYVRTEPHRDYHGDFEQVYQVQTGESREVYWRRNCGKTPDLAALPIRHVWLVASEEKDVAVSTGGLVFLAFFMFMLLCAGAVFALSGLAAVAFCLLGPWLL
ncbi:hypothetical protein [Streptomyces sp. NBC_01198]|uniref:hypothetical protein n=1 Tax=Streptomyces sp. NBC_01198 TaxID=2903769 RepID=UPI002E122EDD|nr:hypothetical protein OG702_09140 [Streptomyces sp. NBC_01198]